MATNIILTDIAIRNLRAPENGVAQHPDGKIPGFGVRVTARGLKSFYYRYRLNGATSRLNLGRYPETSLSAARDLADEARVYARKGIDPRSRLAPDSATVARPGTHINTTTAYLFQNAMQAYIDLYSKPNNKPSTVAEKERLLRAVFNRHWHNRSIKELRKADVLAIIDPILRRGTESAARHAYKEISAFFNWCVRRDYLTVSPCNGLQPPAPARSRERVLTDDEICAIWSAAQKQGYPFGTIVQLCLLTGQRRCEVAGMLWAELDREKMLWSMPGRRVKNGKPHDVPLTPQALVLINRIPRFETRPHADGGESQKDMLTSRFNKLLTSRTSNYVFPSRSDPKESYSGFSKGKRILDAASGVRNWTLHDLRRTAASRMAELGVMPHVIEKILNHVGVAFSGVAGVYNRHDYRNEKRGALELWANHVESILAPTSYARGSEQAVEDQGAAASQSILDPGE